MKCFIPLMPQEADIYLLLYDMAMMSSLLTVTVISFFQWCGLSTKQVTSWWNLLPVTVSTVRVLTQRLPKMLNKCTESFSISIKPSSTLSGPSEVEEKSWWRSWGRLCVWAERVDTLRLYEVHTTLVVLTTFWSLLCNRLYSSRESDVRK